MSAMISDIEYVKKTGFKGNRLKIYLSQKSYCS